MNETDERGLAEAERNVLDDPVDRLELSRRSIKWLGYAGVNTIRDLILLDEADVLALTNMGKGCIRDIDRALGRIGLALGKTVEELENINLSTDDSSDNFFSLSTRITSLGLSRRSTNALVKSGMQNLRELMQLRREDIESIPNLGVDSVSEISKVLRKHGVRLGMKLPSDLSSAGANNSNSIPDAFSVPSGFKSVNLQQLGFSPRTINCLLTIDITNAFDLASQTFSYFSRIPNMGKRSRSEIETSLTALYEACDSSGNFSLLEYANNSKIINCIPRNYCKNEPADFVSAIWNFFHQFCDILNERERAIAQSRIFPIEGKHLTLEELGKKFNITRERVRQIEKKVVNRLAGLLCEGEAIRNKKTKAVYICDIEFSNSWKKAVQRFEGVDETDLHTFAEQLSDTWNIDFSTVIPVLPLVIVVFTRSTTTFLSRDVLNDSRIEAPMKYSSKKVRRTKLSSFRIGKHSEALAT